jgi:hypothetical protein
MKLKPQSGVRSAVTNYADADRLLRTEPQVQLHESSRSVRRYGIRNQRRPSVETPTTRGLGIDAEIPVEPTARAFAGVRLDVNDMFGSHVMSCRRAVLELHLDSPRAPRGQCAPLGRSSSGEPEQTAFDRGELPIR